MQLESLNTLKLKKINMGSFNLEAILIQLIKFSLFSNSSHGDEACSAKKIQLLKTPRKMHDFGIGIKPYMLKF